MDTIEVYWKGKFDGRAVQISASDFDPAIHRRVAEGNWIAASKPEPVIDLAQAEDAEPEPVKVRRTVKAK